MLRRVIPVPSPQRWEVDTVNGKNVDGVISAQLLLWIVFFKLSWTDRLSPPLGLTKCVAATAVYVQKLRPRGGKQKLPKWHFKSYVKKTVSVQFSRLQRDTKNQNCYTSPRTWATVNQISLNGDTSNYRVSQLVWYFALIWPIRAASLLSLGANPLNGKLHHEDKEVSENV